MALPLMAQEKAADAPESGFSDDALLSGALLPLLLQALNQIAVSRIASEIFICFIVLFIDL
jgi:hypothetical protein